MAEEKKEKPKEKPEEKKPEKKEAPKPTAPAPMKKGVSKLLKGKNWYKVIAPELFGEKSLGEALAADPSALMGRIIASSLMELTGDPSRYYMTMFFKVTSVDGTVARTSFAGHECTRDFTARIVQLRTQRVDTNDVLELEDGKIRVKTIAICNRRVTHSIAKAVRKKLKELILAATKDKSIDDFVKIFISGELQNLIRAEVNKVYPLRAFEIRKTEVL